MDQSLFKLVYQELPLTRLNMLFSPTLPGKAKELVMLSNAKLKNANNTGNAIQC